MPPLSAGMGSGKTTRPDAKMGSRPSRFTSAQKAVLKRMAAKKRRQRDR